jgi:cell division protease FtsH
MKGLIELAELLLEKEVIFSEDLERIFGKRTAEILKEQREAEKAKTVAITSDKEEIVPEKTKKKKKNGHEQSEPVSSNKDPGKPSKKSKQKD